MLYQHIKQTDPEMYEVMMKECERQQHGIELIPSENYTSWEVLEANGSILTNKYSEGYPGKRYYGGQENIDVIEQLAIDRAKALFGAEHVNVQPYSGSPANAEVYFALLEFGDTIMGLKLDHGGHITHGLPISYSGKAYNWIPYTVEEDGFIDMDKVEEIAMREKPKMIVAGFSAYTRNMDWKRFAEICKKVGAIAFADICHISGLIAGKALENPVPYFDVVMTTTHKSLRGPRGAIIMCKKEYARKIDRAVFPGFQGGPHDNTTAAKAICFKQALTIDFQEYAEQVIKNAKAMAEVFNELGYRLISGGTDNHLLLMDVTPQGLSGNDAQVALDKACITLNKNTIPNDQRSPMDPSGIRFGTPAMTTRGFKEAEMKQVAQWMHMVLQNSTNEDVIKKVANEVNDMCKNYPVDGVLI